MKLFNRPLSFILVLLYKGVAGLLEIVLGALAFLSSFFIEYLPVTQFLENVFANELTEDPTDIFANWLITQSPFVFTQNNLLRSAIILIVLGLLKIILIAGLWFKSKKVRNIALLFFSLVTIFGIYQLISAFSFLTFIFIIVDALIIYYLWRVYPKHIAEINV
ncbi:MAG: DUF2127 domain-containing protein [bacterium]